MMASRRSPDAMAPTPSRTPSSCWHARLAQLQEARRVEKHRRRSAGSRRHGADAGGPAPAGGEGGAALRTR